MHTIWLTKASMSLNRFTFGETEQFFQIIGQYASQHIVTQLCLTNWTVLELSKANQFNSSLPFKLTAFATHPHLNILQMMEISQFV